MNPLYLFFGNSFLRKNGVCALLFALLSLMAAKPLSACDQSGYIINSLIDNGDGTFTIDLTVLVAGGTVPNLGSTWGFYWNVDATIISVSPASLTSSNGTTLNAIFAGGSIQWGDPTPSPSVPFVDINNMGPTESFPVIVVVSSLPSEWSGGGMEGNNCPGGAGTNPPNYEGEFPCLPPFITAQPVPPACAGDVIQLSVTPVPAYLTDQITWEPGGLMGETVTVTPTETTEYTVTASNACEEFTLTIIVDVTPLPTIEAFEPDVETCAGFPLFMEVLPQNEITVTWTPGNNIGNLLIETATVPTVYTATATNMCGEASADINVTIIPPPTIDILNNNEIICDGNSIELESDAMNANTVDWLPGNLNGENILVSPSSTTQYVVIASNNCGADFDSIMVTVATTDSVQITLEACAGENVLYNGIPLSPGSTSTFTHENVVGCDSVVTVFVEAVDGYATSLELPTCEGTTVVYEGQTLSPGDVEEFSFTASNGCDSVVTVTVLELENFATPVQLTTCASSTINYNGQTLTQGQVVDFNFTAINGCDSIVTVTVVGLPEYDIAVELQTCTGTTIPYNGQQLMPGSTTVFDLTTINGCDSIVTVTVEELANFATAIQFNACTGSTATYNGQPLMPGTVTDFNFTTALGCDSIVTVTVNEVTVIEEQANFSACAGESVFFNGQSVLAGTVMDFNFTTAQGCDSVVTVTVEELPIYALPLTLQACTGSSVLYNGVELSPSTTTDVMLTTDGGCDSLMTVTVDEVASVTASLTLGACTGKTVLFKGQQLAAGSVTDFTFVSSLGCDSILTVTVEEYPTYNQPLTLQACTGSTVTYNGVPLSPGTNVAFTFPTVNGCDSVVSVTVQAVQIIYNELEFETCENTFITYNGQQLAPGTETDFTFTSTLGCDSIVTVIVNEADQLTGAESFDACVGTTVLYNGQSLDAGTVTDFTLVTPNGCDSIVTVTVNALQTFASPLTLEACTGSTTIYNGQQLAVGSVTDFTLTAINGCDSVVTVTVNEVLALTGDAELFACTGTTATYNGQALAVGSVTDFTLTASNGCDSVVTVTVTEIFAQSNHVDLEACTGSAALYNGQPLMAGTVTDFTFTSYQGCDSVVTVTVEELLPQSASLQLEACNGESVQYGGQSILAGTVADVILTAANGCDSVVTVTVNELAATTGSITLQGCEGEILLYNGTQIPAGTAMDFTLINAVGCDSVVTVTALDPIPFVETFEAIEVCEGESAIIFGQPISDPGVYSETYSGINGCDSIHTVTFTVANDLVIAFQDNISIGLGETVVLNPLVPSSDSLAYSWTEDPTLSCLDCQHPVASPLDNTTYFLTVVNEKGCDASSDVLVLVRKERGVFIPNSFSPNDDGINDVFMVFSDQKSVANILSFQVFSRWGESVYEYYNFPPNDPTFGWNGKYRDEELDPSVFAYMVEVEFVDGIKKLFKGDVTIVK